MNNVARRGDIWWARIGSAGIRPAVILTSDAALSRLTNVTLVPVTSRVRGLDTEVLLTPEQHGLDRRSVANCHNILTVHRTNLIAFISHTDQETMNAISEAIHIALDLPW